MLFSFKTHKHEDFPQGMSHNPAVQRSGPVHGPVHGHILDPPSYGWAQAEHSY